MKAIKVIQTDWSDALLLFGSFCRRLLVYGCYFYMYIILRTSMLLIGITSTKIDHQLVAKTDLVEEQEHAFAIGA